MIGITGATGRLGSLIIQELISKIDPSTIVAFVRNIDKVQVLQELGIHVRIADYADKQSFVAGLKDIDILLLISASEIGKRVNQHKNVIEAAKESNIKTFLYAGFVWTKKPDRKLLLEHYETEELIRESGLTYLICRDSHYMEPMIADMQRIINEGIYYTSASNGFAYVSIPDLARTYAELLAHPEKIEPNTVINLTGPELITPEQYFSMIQSQTTKKLEFKHVSDQQMKEYLLSLHVSEKSLDGWLGFERMQSEGVVSVITDDIEHITGKKPVSMKDFLEKSKNS